MRLSSLRVCLGVSLVLAGAMAQARAAGIAPTGIVPVLCSAELGAVSTNPAGAGMAEVPVARTCNTAHTLRIEVGGGGSVPNGARAQYRGQAIFLRSASVLVDRRQGPLTSTDTLRVTGLGARPELSIAVSITPE